MCFRWTTNCPLPLIPLYVAVAIGAPSDRPGEDVPGSSDMKSSAPLLRLLNGYPEQAEKVPSPRSSGPNHSWLRYWQQAPTSILQVDIRPLILCFPTSNKTPSVIHVPRSDSDNAYLSERFSATLDWTNVLSMVAFRAGADRPDMAVACLPAIEAKASYNTPVINPGQQAPFFLHLHSSTLPWTIRASHLVALTIIGDRLETLISCDGIEAVLVDSPGQGDVGALLSICGHVNIKPILMEINQSQMNLFRDLIAICIVRPRAQFVQRPSAAKLPKVRSRQVLYLSETSEPSRRHGDTPIPYVIRCFDLTGCAAIKYGPCV